MLPEVKMWILALAWMAIWAATAGGEVLIAGPDQQYRRPSAALRAAQDGDVVEIQAGVYRNDRARIGADDLTIRGTGGRAVLHSDGMIPNGKAIWVVAGDNTRIENVEFRGARVPDGNGAGIRLEGNDLVVRRCGFFNNENGILGGSGDCVVDIRHCEFGGNSLRARPGTHNLYIGRCRKLVFTHNYSHHARRCHLLKSRARTNIIMYNRLSDEESGASSYVINLPNAGRARIAGNILHQGRNCRNRTVVAYGEEGPRDEGNSLWFVNNTVINDSRPGTPTFVSIRGLPDDFRAVLLNNIFAGKGQVTNHAGVLRRGNFTGSAADAGFVDRSAWNLRLRGDSPCLDAGIPPDEVLPSGTAPLSWQYRHPAGREPRPRNGAIDIGAYEYAE